MEEEKVLLNATVCLLVKNNQVLLALKTKKIGAGCRNGYGGGIEEGENIKESAVRELEEETGKELGKEFITAFPEDLEKVAIIDFDNMKSDGSSFVCKVHFFIIRDWFGEVENINKENDENTAMIDPIFFDINNLPLDQLMPADREFFPLILNGKKIIGKAKYGPFQKELLEPMTWEEVNSFPEE
jgi:8-oxo-dGTP pyrophosphatase MutT (NUDIX family)